MVYIYIVSYIHTTFLILQQGLWHSKEGSILIHHAFTVLILLLNAVIVGDPIFAVLVARETVVDVMMFRSKFYI